MANILEKVFGKKERRVAPVKRQLTPKQMDQVITTQSLVAFSEYLKQNPDLMVELAMQRMHFKKPNYVDQLLEREAESNPAIKDALIEQALRIKKLEKADWKDQLIETKEFYEMMFPQQQESRGGLGSFLNPEMIKAAIEAAAPFLMNMNPQLASPANGTNGHHKLIQGASHTDMTDTDTTTDTNVQQTNFHQTVDPLDQYIEDLLYKFTEADADADDCARFALFQLNYIAQETMKANGDMSKVNQINQVLRSDAPTMLVMLQIGANLSGRTEYQEAVKQLDTAEGKHFLEDFCIARDAVLEEIRKGEEK